VPLRSVDTLFGQSADGFTAWSVSRERLEERITKLRGEMLAPWRLHDLRRSISSTLVEQYEIEPHIAAALLGHAIGSKVDRGYIYARYEAPLRRALSVWGRHIEELLTDADRKVLPLSREAS